MTATAALPTCPDWMACQIRVRARALKSSSAALSAAAHAVIGKARTIVKD